MEEGTEKLKCRLFHRLHETRTKTETELLIGRHASLITVIAVPATSTGIVHTSYQCRHLANQYGWMSVNHFPYLPIVWRTRITIPVSRRWSGSPLKFNHLFIGQLQTFRENFMQIRFEFFLLKIANRRANRQRRSHISSLMEVMISSEMALIVTACHIEQSFVCDLLLVCSCNYVSL